MDSLSTLRREQDELRHRVRSLLASCAGDVVAGAPQLPPLPVERGQAEGARGSTPRPPHAAHTELQRALLSFLVQRGGDLTLPLRVERILSLLLEKHPELRPFETQLSPAGVERALLELHGLAPNALQIIRGELVTLDTPALDDFHDRLIRRPAARPMTPSPSTTAPAVPDKGGRKRPASAAHDGEMAEVMELLGAPSTKQREKLEHADELLQLLEKPTARQASQTEKFRTQGGSKLREFCRYGTKEACSRQSGQDTPCCNIHFRRIIKPHTDPTLGDCSYLDTCRHMSTCRFIHYEVDRSDAQRLRQGAAEKNFDPLAQKAKNRVGDDPFRRHYDSQFVNCDIRTFPMATLGKFAVLMADPPWDIHMELPYGTMSDDEMRQMNVQVLQDDGVIFLWVTGRAMELGRECLEIWGYRFVQELLWVKTNQLQRIIRTGRTGHWLNHSKEHCLIGVKGKLDPRIFNVNLDCDVICAEVRETSRKPDEMYDLLERLAPGQRKLEMFGRPHNVHKGWTTLGNQLGKTQISEPWLRQHLLDEGVFEECDLAPMPRPPADPIVPPWGGHSPPEPLSKAEKIPKCE